MTKLIIMLKIATEGVANGLPRKPATVDQSRPKDPMPSPFSPEPICCIVIEFLFTKQRNEMAEMAGKMKPGMA